MERGATWAFVAPHPHRHDPGHAVSLRLQATPAAAAAALRLSGGGGGGSAQGQGQPRGPSHGAFSADGSGEQAEYLMLLSAADVAAGRAADTHLEEEGNDLSEMHVARILSRMLPESHGLFLGNSMPVRDMDMYASSVSAPSPSASASVSTYGSADETGASGVLLGPDWPSHMRQTSPDNSGEDGDGTGSGGGGGSGGGRNSAAVGSGFGVGVPIASNRGASGIDGVVSTASGFAFGLARPTTLLIGDVSFTHDTNGLLLLRRAGAATIRGAFGYTLLLFVCNNISRRYC